MRPDFLTSEVCDRSRACTMQYKIIRGTVSQLLITNSATWHYKDLLTVKLRHAAGTLIIVDRVSCLYLALLTDLKQGFPTTGTPEYVGSSSPAGNNEERGGLVAISTQTTVVINSLLLPLGHITLTGKEELEVTVETARQPEAGGAVGTMRLSLISGRARVDTILGYETSSDLEAQVSSIREMYLFAKKFESFFDNLNGSQGRAFVGKNINVKLNVDGEDSEDNLDGYGAITAITGQLTLPPSNLVRVFQDFETLPASLYYKVTGDDKAMADILFIRELAVPHMIGASVSAAIGKEMKRVEQLEANDPERARALVQLGTIAPSSSLAAVKDDFVPAVSAPIK